MPFIGSEQSVTGAWQETTATKQTKSAAWVCTAQ